MSVSSVSICIIEMVCAQSKAIILKIIYHWSYMITPTLLYHCFFPSSFFYIRTFVAIFPFPLHLLIGHTPLPTSVSLPFYKLFSKWSPYMAAWPHSFALFKPHRSLLNGLSLWFHWLPPSLNYLLNLSLLLSLINMDIFQTLLFPVYPLHWPSHTLLF